MNNQLKITEIIKGEIAVSTSDGNLVYERINSILKDQNSVELDFSGINILTTAFLNAAIGQLYSNEYTSKFLNDHLKITNVSTNHTSLFQVVIKRAKEYFENKNGFESSIGPIIYGD